MDNPQSHIESEKWWRNISKNVYTLISLGVFAPVFFKLVSHTLMIENSATLKSITITPLLLSM